jgi:hypothetical protein
MDGEILNIAIITGVFAVIAIILTIRIAAIRHGYKKKINSLTAEEQIFE